MQMTFDNVEKEVPRSKQASARFVLSGKNTFRLCSLTAQKTSLFNTMENSHQILIFFSVHPQAHASVCNTRTPDTSHRNGNTAFINANYVCEFPALASQSCCSINVNNFHCFPLLSFQRLNYRYSLISLITRKHFD